jgi:uncharacterized membrane protein YphA (DoxX/SURF4 family)
MAPFESLRNSNLVIRWSLAIIFVWFGVDKFIHPEYWINAWYPESISRIMSKVGLGGREFMNMLGIIETLTGISMVTGLFLKWFAGIGVVLMLLGIIFFGFNEVMVRNLAIIGGFAALLLWPSRRSI